MSTGRLTPWHFSTQGLQMTKASSAGKGLSGVRLQRPGTQTEICPASASQTAAGALPQSWTASQLPPPNLQDRPLLQEHHLLQPQLQLPRQLPCPLRPSALRHAAFSPAKPSETLKKHYARSDFMHLLTSSTTALKLSVVGCKCVCMMQMLGKDKVLDDMQCLQSCA